MVGVLEREPGPDQHRDYAGEEALQKRAVCIDRPIDTFKLPCMTNVQWGVYAHALCALYLLPGLFRSQSRGILQLLLCAHS